MRAVARCAVVALLLPLAACSPKPASYADHNFASTEEMAKLVKLARWSCSLTNDEKMTADSLGRNGFDNSVRMARCSSTPRMRSGRRSMRRTRLRRGKAKIQGSSQMRV